MEKEEVTEETNLQPEIIPEKIPFWQNPKIPIVIGLVVVSLTILVGGWLIWKSQRQMLIPLTQITFTSEIASQCKDRSYVADTAAYIIEGTVERIRLEHPGGRKTPIAYNDIRIEKYVKGDALGENKIQIVVDHSLGGAVHLQLERMGVKGELPKFEEREKVRVYFEERNGKFLITCSLFGVEKIPSVTRQVTITTDKTEYRLYECMEIKVKNEGKETICFEECNDCPCFLPISTCPVHCYFFSLERKENNSNYKIIEDWMKEWDCENSAVGECLGPGESEIFTEYCIYQNPSEDALYRITLPLSFSCFQERFRQDQVAYSNEFMIKRVDFPFVEERVNFYNYPSGEIVLGDGENTGETLIKKDLDGDGKQEEIYIEKVRFPKRADFVLHIDERSQKTDFWATDFSIVDIDESDNYQEVVLHNPGPSNDDVSLFFWYNGQEIKEMGKLARWPKILGNGEVEVADWMGFWAKTDTYLLNKETHLLEWVPKETYEVGIKTKALGTIRLYKEKSYDSKVVKEIKPGEEVEILIAESCDTYFCEWWQFEAGGIKGWSKDWDEYKLELGPFMAD